MSSPEALAFRPTQAMIQAAELVFITMAMQQSTEDVVRGYERQILASGQWHVAQKWVDMGALADRVILDPKQAYLLSEVDYAEFTRQCEIERQKARLPVRKEGNCPLCEVEADLLDAKRLLVDAMSPVTKLSSDKLLMNMDLYKRSIDLCLKLLAPYVDPHKTFGLSKVLGAVEGGHSS